MEMNASLNIRINQVLLFIVLALAFVYNPVTSDWGAKPTTYLFFFTSLLFSILLIPSYFSGLVMRLNPIDLTVLLFFVLLIVHVIYLFCTNSLSIDDYLLTYAAIGILYFPLRSLIQKDCSSVVQVFSLIFDIQVVLGICQLTFALIKNIDSSLFVTGTLGHSGMYAIYLVAYLPVRIKKVAKVKKTLILVVIFILLLMTESRTGICLYLIVLANLSRHYLSNFYHRTKGKTWLIVSSAIALITLVSLLIYIKLPSAMGRIFIWQNSFNLFLKKPFLGWGYGGFQKEYLNQQAFFFEHNSANEMYTSVASSISTPFNEYIKLLVNFGFVGFAIFGFALFSLYKFLWTTNSNTSFSFSFFLILLSALVYFSFQSVGLLLVAILCLVYLADHSWPDIYINWCLKIKSKLILIIKLTLLTFCTFLLSNNFNQFVATLKWRQAIRFIPNQPELAMNVYSQIYDRLHHRPSFIYNYGVELYNLRKYNQAQKMFAKLLEQFVTLDGVMYFAKASQAVGQYDLAEQYFKQASFMVPNKFQPKYHLFKLYDHLKSEKNAAIVAQEILDMPIKVPSQEVDHIRKRVKQYIKLELNNQYNF
ncbi:O-antigen ligase family protein [Sphingobacterium corticibacter]|uniref:O-antigen ligase-related domain-containing protein n=1 Tax=Sphingobacterium corticibacter TaxID=2171749 RepID=A0A2T8HM58_9SPHI|nr:O-antigen ligase family protein [Sphingobacterium corticibacter]PVH26480.1 hypothetical protein DC487_02355 [Sphingobacterium corticibacter]